MAAADARSLYDPNEHGALAGAIWDEQRVRPTVDEIVERTRDGFVPDRFWPRHQLDEYGSAAVADKTFWIGAAGVLWAIDRLGAGLGEAGLYEAYLTDPEFPGSTGLMMGETGVALVSWKLAPNARTEERLFALVEGNLASPSMELFNGSPGTMLAALHMYEATGSERWRGLWERCADWLLEQFHVDPELGCRIWVQHRHGRLIRSVGAGHGFASNLHSLLRGRALLGAERAAQLERWAIETASKLALESDGLVNWPTAADRHWAEQFPTRVQWCHGAPGMITSLCALPRDERLDALLAAAGELTWRAGPLNKGAGLCHGTAGNGCAFLALHQRFQENLWLDRARAFAMHAIGQLSAETPRHSLWTGDIGVALYLHACLNGFEGMPVLDTF